MWLMLQQEKPEDFVISTGEMHSVREFVEMSFRHVNKTIKWEGNDEDEIGIEVETGIVRVKINKKYYRPTEVVSVLHSYSQ